MHEQTTCRSLSPLKCVVGGSLLQFNNTGLQNCTYTGKKFSLIQTVCSAPKKFVAESLGQTKVTVYYSLPENKYVNQPDFQLSLTFSGDKLVLKVSREANGVFAFPPACSSKECNDLHLGKFGSIIMNAILLEVQHWQILTSSEFFNTFCRNYRRIQWQIRLDYNCLRTDEFKRNCHKYCSEVQLVDTVLHHILYVE